VDTERVETFDLVRDLERRVKKLEKVVKDTEKAPDPPADKKK
jgi:hypothetical protein